MERENLRVYCSDDEPDHILGWIAYTDMGETRYLHMVFVKRDFRRNGIATDLIDSVFSRKPIFTTHWSRYMKELDAGRRWGVKYSGGLLAACVYEILEGKCQLRPRTADSHL